MNTCAILIPVHQPQAGLCKLVGEIKAELHGRHLQTSIWIVDDGSDADHSDLLRRLEAVDGVRVVRHAIHLGKGAALKTGINAILAACPNVASVVTANADGRHTASDIVRVLVQAQAKPDRLYLGVHRSTGIAPARESFGIRLAGTLTSFLSGLPPGATQATLRAIPPDLCEAALRISLNGYDFELECLIAFRRVRREKLGIKLVPIDAAAANRRHGWNFNPLLDSMRIYFVFLRYCASSLVTFTTDYLVFVTIFGYTHSIGIGIAGARTIATFVSFYLNRHAVFHSGGRVAGTLARFILLVVALGWISYLGTSYLVHSTGMPAVYAKFSVECVLFFAGFALSNTFVFGQAARAGESTDWDDYYSRPYRAASVTRRITTQLLIQLMREYAAAGERIVELGGANSCFVNALRTALKPGEYHIVDNNSTGLSLSRHRIAPGEAIYVHEVDLLTGKVPVQGDVTFSVGLIEHFDVAGTARLIDEHFAATRPEGVVILSYPTPTWLYWLIRRAAERAGLWIFFDERPLSADEVLVAARRHGKLLDDRINWKIGLTQRVMVFRRMATAAC